MRTPYNDKYFSFIWWDFILRAFNSLKFSCTWSTGAWRESTIYLLYFFKFKFIYFNWRLITLQYCGGFCHTFTWISHGCTYVPHPDPPYHLPPHPIPLGHPTAPALSTLSHASNLDWLSVSHMIIYMFQCYSLRSSHPRLLPQSKRLFYTSVETAQFKQCNESTIGCPGLSSWWGSLSLCSHMLLIRVSILPLYLWMFSAQNVP